MADQKLIDEVGKYIDKYYEPAKDDIKMDKEMKSILIESQASGKRELRKKHCRISRFWRTVRQKNRHRKNLIFRRCRRRNSKKECLLQCR